MRLSKIILRDAFDEVEIERYQDVTLQALVEPLADGTSATPKEDVAAQGQDGGTEEGDPATGAATDAVPPSPEEVLQAARQEAETLLAQARAQAEALRQEAAQHGHAQGRTEGQAQAKKELLPALVAFAQAGQSILVLEEQMVARLAPELVRLGIDIAEKLIGKHVQEDPQIVAAVLERARAELPHARQVRIWLHPEDRRLLAELRPDLVSIGEVGERSVEVCDAQDIGRGGCRVETEMGVIDATFPVQLQEVGRQLLDEEAQ